MGMPMSTVSTFSHNRWGRPSFRGGVRGSPVEISFSDNHGELNRKYKALELPGMDDEKFDGFDIGLDKKLRDLALVDNRFLVDYLGKRLPGKSDLGQARQYRTDVTIGEIYRMFIRARKMTNALESNALESNEIVSDLFMGSDSLETLGVEFLRMADWLSSSAEDLLVKGAKSKGIGSKVNHSLPKSKVNRKMFKKKMFGVRE